MSKRQLKKLKIVWAVDAFEKPTETRSAIVKTLSAMVDGRREVQIYPVYVLSPDSLQIPLELARPWNHYYSKAAKKALEQAIQDTPLGGIQEASVLFQSRPSLSQAVRRLVKFAERQDADLIVLGTHARQGLSRLVLGSFAETALLQSKVPTLVVGPEAQSGPLKEMLYATDLGARSRQGFKSAMRLAQVLRLKLTILHTVTHPVEPVFQSGVYLLGGGWIPASEYVTQNTDDRRILGERWAVDARKAGLDANFILDTGTAGVTQSILNASADRQNCLIALASQSGRISSTLIGSVTRQVVRQARCPVWVVRG